MKRRTTRIESGPDDNRLYIFVASLSLIILYSLAAILDQELLFVLNAEDGVIENLTSIAFFLTAVIFLIFFVLTKQAINLLFVLIFVFGAGEEISWGQRIFGFETPESIEAVNAQEEFNIHNLHIFTVSPDKEGVSRYLGIGILYLLFCLTYGIFLPLLVRWSGFVRKIVQWTHLPVPCLSLGIFFLINYLLYKGIGNLINVEDRLRSLINKNIPSFHSVIDESFELASAIIFLLIAISFLSAIKKLET